MKPAPMVALTGLALSLLMAAAPALAQRAANDPRKLCREQIQKANGLGKDAKVSRKQLDACVARGGKL